MTLVLQQMNFAYYTEVLWMRPWTLEPDRLSIFPPEEIAEGYTFETVNQKHVLSDRTRTMELYNVQGLAHAVGMLMVYLPKEKIVIEADLFTPPAPKRRSRPLPPLPTRLSRTTCNA